MFFDTDAGGVVHNVAWLRMIEVARTHLVAEMGMSLEEMAVTQEFPVVVRTEIDYIRPARLGEKLLIAGRLDSFSKAKFWCAFDVRRERDDVLLVQCRQMLALVRMPAGKPVRIPERWSRDYPELRETKV
jgi:YbgC/YbaW family acyl-CoA thioester hydrolase